MVRDLGLKGVELLVFARIYGFCRCRLDFFESRQGTANFLGMTRRSVIKAMIGLVEKGLIVETGKSGGHPNSTKRYTVARRLLEPTACCSESGQPHPGAEGPGEAFRSGEDFSLLEDVY